MTGLTYDETEDMSFGQKEWYYKGKATCVAYGSSPDGNCDTSLYVCSEVQGENGKGTYGTQKDQAAKLKEAVENGGVHPDCPRTASESKFECDLLGTT